jgi:outer membrane receptor protein involved in Fe transport
LEYQYDQFERGEEYTVLDRVRKVKTHRVPLGMHYFHPCGFSAKTTVTYFDQKGDFQPQGAAGFDPFTGNPVFQSGKDDFWLVDAAISYRLPKRLGLITLGANNLFDESFQYADMDPANPSIQPSRFIYAKASFAF